MKNFCKQYKTQLVLTGYLIFLGIFIYGGIFAMVNNIKEKADEIQKKIIDNEVDKKNLEKIPQLMEDYATFSAESGNFDVILSKESEIEFIKSLEDLAKETGNEINLKLIAEENLPEKTKTAKEKDKKDIVGELPYKDYITIQLELKGKYPQLVKFMRKLENMNYYANIISIDLKKEEKKSEDNLSSSPFISADNAAAPTEKKKEEILKSLINLVVYTKQ